MLLQLSVVSTQFNTSTDPRSHMTDTQTKLSTDPRSHITDTQTKRQTNYCIRVGLKSCHVPGAVSLQVSMTY